MRVTLEGVLCWEELLLALCFDCVLGSTMSTRSQTGAGERVRYCEVVYLATTQQRAV